MNRSNLAVGVVVAAALVVGVSALRSSGSLSSDDSVAAVAKTASVAPSALVVYTNEGFIPKTLKVTRGTTIRFFNASSRSALRVAPRVDASNQSTGNLELAASRSVKLGESFEVSVTAPGTWGYENLNAPNLTGTVVVE